MADWAKVLADLGVELRPPLPSAGLYNSVVVENGFAFTSGTVAVEGDPLRLAYPGCLGKDISIEDAELSARGAIISTLGNLAGSLGGLERVERFVKLLGYVRATPDFEHTPKVMDGASQLLADVFGRELLPARTAIGVSALPGGASVEVDTIVKLVTTTYDLVSVDDHVIEPPGVWVDRLPKKYLEEGPHVIEADGRQYWVYEGERATTMGLNAVAGKSREEYSMEPARYSDMIPGCYDPVQRGRDLASNGIRGSLCFPTFPRFAGVTFLRAKDKDLAYLCVRAYNDFMIDEWCAAVPGLFIPMIIGTLWDPQLMAAEIRRSAAKGARALTFPENTHALGLPSFHSDYFDPVWEAVCETDTAVCIHIGTSGIVPLPSPDASFSIGIALAPGAAWSTCTDLIMGPIPRKFPTIKITLSEGGIGWVPFALERADRTWDRHRYWSGLDDLRPSEVFRRNIWVCFIDEEMGIEARHRIGVDKIMWECDYPHADTPWPDSQKDVAKVLAGVPDDEVALMTHGNAERLFRWTTRPEYAATTANGAAGNGVGVSTGAGAASSAVPGGDRTR